MKTQYLCYPLLKHVWLFSQKIKGQQTFNLFPVTVQLLCQLGGSSEQARACQPKTMSHWLQLYFSFNGQRLFQLRVSATRLHTLFDLSHSAIPTSSTGRRLLSTWKSVQEHTQNLRCRRLSVLTDSKSLKFMTKLKITLEFTSHDILEPCIICLNNFNNQKELISHINILP